MRPRSNDVRRLAYLLAAIALLCEGRGSVAGGALCVPGTEIEALYLSEEGLRTWPGGTLVLAREDRTLLAIACEGGRAVVGAADAADGRKGRILLLERGERGWTLSGEVESGWLPVMLAVRGGRIAAVLEGPRGFALTFLDAAPGARAARIPIPERPRDLTLAPDGESFLVAIGSSVRSFRVADGRTWILFPFPEPVGAIAGRPGVSRFLVGQGTAVVAIDPKDRADAGRFPIRARCDLAGAPREIVWSIDGRFAAVLLEEEGGAITFLGGEDLAVLDRHEGAAEAIAVLPTGHLLRLPAAGAAPSEIAPDEARLASARPPSDLRAVVPVNGPPVSDAADLEPVPGSAPAPPPAASSTPGPAPTAEKPTPAPPTPAPPAAPPATAAAEPKTAQPAPAALTPPPPTAPPKSATAVPTPAPPAPAPSSPEPPAAPPVTTAAAPTTAQPTPAPPTPSPPTAPPTSATAVPTPALPAPAPPSPLPPTAPPVTAAAAPTTAQLTPAPPSPVPSTTPPATVAPRPSQIPPSVIEEPPGAPDGAAPIEPPPARAVGNAATRTPTPPAAGTTEGRTLDAPLHAESLHGQPAPPAVPTTPVLPAKGTIEVRIAGRADLVGEIVVLGPDSLVKESARGKPETADGVARFAARGLTPGRYRIVPMGVRGAPLQITPAYRTVSIVGEEGATVSFILSSGPVTGRE